jgi:hypothetical protein
VQSLGANARGAGLIAFSDLTGTFLIIGRIHTKRKKDVKDSCQNVHKLRQRKELDTPGGVCSRERVARAM